MKKGILNILGYTIKVIANKVRKRDIINYIYIKKFSL
jgi:hypothetical protein